MCVCEYVYVCMRVYVSVCVHVCACNVFGTCVCKCVRESRSKHVYVHPSVHIPVFCMHVCVFVQMWSFLSPIRNCRHSCVTMCARFFVYHYKVCLTLCQAGNLGHTNNSGEMHRCKYTRNYNYYILAHSFLFDMFHCGTFWVTS